MNGGLRFSILHRFSKLDLYLFISGCVMRILTLFPLLKMFKNIDMRSVKYEKNMVMFMIAVIKSLVMCKYLYIDIYISLYGENLELENSRD